MDDVEAARALVRKMLEKYGPSMTPEGMDANRQKHIAQLAMQSTWKKDDPFTLELLLLGIEDDDADRAIRAEFMKYVDRGEPLPRPLGRYVCNRPKPKRRKRPGSKPSKWNRDFYFGSIIAQVERLGIKPTRNDETKPTRTDETTELECGCSIVADETGLAYGTVKKAWIHFNKVWAASGDDICADDVAEACGYKLID